MTADDLPGEARVGRVALAVADLDRLTDFYERVVGLSLRERTDDRALLGAESGEPFLELHESDAPERGLDETGLFHVAFRVPDRTALGAALERVEARWLLDGASDHLVSEALYFRDPEENGIEIYCDQPRAEWPRTETGVEMDSLRLDLDSLLAASDGAATVPEGSDVGHVHLEVSDLAAARDFYGHALGFGVRDEWRDASGLRALFLAAGDYHHHVGLNTWNDCTAPARGLGLAWFEVVVPDDALDAVEARFRDAGIEVGATDEGLVVTDTDGIEVRVRSASGRV